MSNKNKIEDRAEWLARRATPSLGRLQRARGRYKFISAPLTLVDENLATAHYIVNKDGKATYYNGKVLRPVPEGKKGFPVWKGRNERKRLHRATKESRGHWRKVA